MRLFEPSRQRLCNCTGYVFATGRQLVAATAKHERHNSMLRSVMTETACLDQGNRPYHQQQQHACMSMSSADDDECCVAMQIASARFASILLFLNLPQVIAGVR
jgi:hypothetical protein